MDPLYFFKCNEVFVICFGSKFTVFYCIRKEQGKRHGQTGNETACNRERYGMSLNSNARTHELGRAPLYLGAPALICWSGRSKPSFIP